MVILCKKEIKNNEENILNFVTKKTNEALYHSIDINIGSPSDINHIATQSLMINHN